MTADDATPEHGIGRSAPDEEPVSPRSFAIGAGIVFGAAGTLLALGSCCIWSLSGLGTDGFASAPAPTQWWEFLQTERAPSAVGTLAAAVTLVCGMGMAGAGVGLYGELRHSGVTACVFSGLLAATWWTCVVVFLVQGGAWGLAAVAGVVALIASALFAVAWQAARVLRKHPPPADQSRVTEEMLRQMTGRKGHGQR